MRVLSAFEFSGATRRAFRALGHDAYSLDLLPAEDGDKHHFEGDITQCPEYFLASWDLLLAFPPCTHLSASGARWWPQKQAEQAKALELVRWLMTIPVPHMAIENPIGKISTAIRKPDQIIQPWQFGHGETKATCLWLMGLPKLKPTNIVDGRVPRVHHASPGPDRWKERSRTLPGIAAAMAEQWGAL